MGFGKQSNKYWQEVLLWFILLFAIIAVSFYLSEDENNSEELTPSAIVLPVEETLIEETKEFAIAKEDIVKKLPVDELPNQKSANKKSELKEDKKTEEDVPATTSDSNSTSAEIVLFPSILQDGEIKSSSPLQWLTDHQEKDGHWNVGKLEGESSPDFDCAATGIALLALISGGHTDKAGKYKLNVRRALTWLIQNQRSSGAWGDTNYINAICALALADALGAQCKEPDLKKTVDLAIDFILKQQNSSGCFDYFGPSLIDDMSISGWCVLALQSASLSEIKTEEIKIAFQKCDEYLKTVRGTSDNTITSQGLAWYTPNQTESGATGGACQAIAMIMRLSFGWARTEPWLVAAAKGQISKIPKNYFGADIYRIYFAYLVFLKMGGEQWKAWDEPMFKLILTSQKHDGDVKGSWDKTGCQLDKGGRVFYTALLFMCIEFHHLHLSLMK